MVVVRNKRKTISMKSFLQKYVRRRKDLSSEVPASNAKAKVEADLSQVKAMAKDVPRAEAKVLSPVTDPLDLPEKGKAREGIMIPGIKVKGKAGAKANAWGKMDIQLEKDQIVQKIVAKAIIPTWVERAVPIMVTIRL